MEKGKNTRMKYWFAIVLMCIITNFYTHAQRDSANYVNSDAEIIEYKHAFSEGLRIKLGGDLNTAKDYFNRCIVLNPESDASMFELAKIYFSQKCFYKKFCAVK